MPLVPAVLLHMIGLTACIISGTAPQPRPCLHGCNNIWVCAALHRHHVWLMILPPEFAARMGSSAEIKQVWRVVCLSALNAMWQTAGIVRNMRVQDREALQQQEGGAPGFLGRQAIVRLQALLHDFAVSGSPPTTWRAALPPDMPFFRFTSADAGLQVACSLWL